MCGIAGIASRRVIPAGDQALVDRMLASLAHRGPDDQWVVSDQHAVLGARRLAIIDLDTGRQPVSNEDESVWVVQNGEIYNYVELRAGLEDLGHRFRTRGDTEAIVHLYETYGEDFVDHLRGMFAIAVWDASRRRLVLARDRLGKKPLYWRFAEDRLIFGSELKAILCDAGVSRGVDRKALALYLQYQYVPSPATILAGIQKLPPASILTWDTGAPTVRRYWTPSYEPNAHRSSPDEEREEGLNLLRESVRLRMRSDVPLAVFLSGGVDSGTIAALVAEQSAKPVRTFTIGFEDPVLDELNRARTIAAHLGANHTDEVVRVDAIGLLPELADHFDEPFGDPSAVPTFRIAQLAAREVKVVLTGDGGDEAFGGYDRYRRQLALSRLSSVPTPVRVAGAQIAQRAVQHLPKTIRRSRQGQSWPRLASLTNVGRYVDTMSIFDSELRGALLGDAGLSAQDGYLAAAFTDGTHGLLNRMMRADILTYLPEDVLVKVDRATMANSLEARSPLLDHRVVEFGARLTVQRKIKSATTKVLLREIARTLLPPRLVDQPKGGFSVPLAHWFKGALAGVYEEAVLGPDSQLRDHLDQPTAAVLLDEHRSGAADHAHRLWLLLTFELWARRWLEKAPST